jgi:hypothetical protein
LSGQNGPILITLEGNTRRWVGRTPPLTQSAVSFLQSDGLYVNVHTPTFPNGELRGQVEARPRFFGAYLDGSQVVPPVTTSAFGNATFSVDAARAVTYNVITNLLTGTGARIAEGMFGSNNQTVFSLSGGPGSWSGVTSLFITPSQLSLMQSRGLHVVVETAANPTGEIRGQIVPSSTNYGIGCARPGNVFPAFSIGGAAVKNGNVIFQVTGGRANSNGVLAASFAPGIGKLLSCPLYIGAPIIQIPLRLDAAGKGSFRLTWPATVQAVTFYVQYFGLDVGMPEGLYSTNAARLTSNPF